MIEVSQNQISLLVNLKVRRSNEFTNARAKGSLNPLASKLVVYAMSQITDKENLKGSFHIREFFPKGNLSSHYRRVHQACQDLAQTAYITRKEFDDKNFKAKYRPLLGSDGIDIEDGMISFQFNKHFYNEIFPERNYTEYLFGNIYGMRSSYSIAIYELLKQGVDRYESRIFELGELKGILGISTDTKTSKTYEIFSQLKRRVLDQACNEITEKSDLDASWEVYKKLGRKVHSIIFYMKRKDSYDLQLDTLEEKEAIAIDAGSGLKGSSEPVVADISVESPKFSAEFKDKLNRLGVRLGEIGLSMSVRKQAIEKYRQNPNWGIWKEINAVKMAMKDGEKFPNRNTLKKFIEGA